MAALGRWAWIFAAVILFAPQADSIAAANKPVAIAWLDHPGSALLLHASLQGFFKEQGIDVTLAGYRDSKEGLRGLDSGKIDAGVFGTGETLRQIAAGKKIRIIGGVGTPVAGGSVATSGEPAPPELEEQGVVVVTGGSIASDKDLQIRIVSALIKAYRDFLNHADSPRKAVELTFPLSGGKQPIRFDPDPDYWRLERLWRSLGLQRDGMGRDFLAGHVDEEIYCDALDRLLDEDERKDPVLLQLDSRAVCVPDCCPIKSGRD